MRDLNDHCRTLILWFFNKFCVDLEVRLAHNLFEIYLFPCLNLLAEAPRFWVFFGVKFPGTNIIYDGINLHKSLWTSSHKTGPLIFHILQGVSTRFPYMFWFCFYLTTIYNVNCRPNDAWQSSVAAFCEVLSRILNLPSLDSFSLLTMWRIMCPWI